MTKNEIVNIAIKSLIYEVSISPKLGLVSRTSFGSHKDMDFFTFIDSSFSMYDYFYKIYEMTENNINLNQEEYFEKLRNLGKDAELKMFDATNGVNTHKGSIFSLGIVFGAFCKLYLKNKVKPSFKKLNIEIKDMCKNIFKDLDNKNIKSYGVNIYKKYGITGARENAHRGYDLVLLDGIEKFFNFTNLKNIEISAILILLYYTSLIDDTNIINRSNLETLNYVKNTVLEIYSKYKNLDFKNLDFKNDIEKLNKFFICKNISAGGSADLLIVTLFLFFIYKE